MIVLPANGMNYIKGILSALAALTIAELVPLPGSVFSGINGSKATGLAALPGGLLESAFSPLFWLVAITIFTLFFVASRLDNRVLRITLFWFPTLAVCFINAVLVTLVTYLVIHSRNP